MIKENPATTQYLSRFESALRRYRLPEWEEIAKELKTHISEAESYGKPIADVIAALGPADTLARAYAVELLMFPSRDVRAPAAVRFLKIISVMVAGSFVSFFVVTILGGMGVSLLAVGLGFIVGGVLDAIGVHLWWINTGGLPPLVVVAIMGPAALAVGWAMCWLLWRYVRMVARALRDTLPDSAVLLRRYRPPL